MIFWTFQIKSIVSIYNTQYSIAITTQFKKDQQPIKTMNHTLYLVKSLHCLLHKYLQLPLKLFISYTQYSATSSLLNAMKSSLSP